MLETVALGLLSGCPSTITSDSIDIPQPKTKGKPTKTKQNEKKKPQQNQTKNKPKKTPKLYKYVFFPEGSRYTRKCSMYILHQRGMKDMCKKATRREAYILLKPFHQRFYQGALHFGMSEHKQRFLQSKTKNTYFDYGTFNEIKSFPKTDRQIPSRK